MNKLEIVMSLFGSTVLKVKSNKLKHNPRNNRKTKGKKNR